MDPSNLPVDVQIQSTRQLVTPAQHAGLKVTFAIKRDKASALVTFVDDEGAYLPPGSLVHINGAGEFVLGYDGQAFLQDLKGSNSVIINPENGGCRASFDFQPAKGKQVRIGPVVCRRTTMASALRPDAERPAGEDLLGIRTAQFK
jgi:outer membrane usher protein